MKKRKIYWRTLIICLLIVFATAFAGSLFTSADSQWYESVKPPITPPNYVFPIVWNILFFLIALSLYFAWISADKNIKNKLKKEKPKSGGIKKYKLNFNYINNFKLIFVFGLNLVLNLLWSILFFRFQNPLFAFYDLILLWLSILLMIYITYKINKTSSYLLIPYLLWVSFAGVLNWLMI